NPGAKPHRRNTTNGPRCHHIRSAANAAEPRQRVHEIFFFKQKTAYEIGLGIPAEPLFRSYVNKKSDMDLAAKGLGAKEWNNSLKTKLSLLPKKLFRIRMSRNFGMKMLTMTNLSTECLIQLTKLGYDATPF